MTGDSHKDDMPAQHGLGSANNHEQSQENEQAGAANVTPNTLPSHQSEQQRDVQSQPEDSDETGAFLQPTFINILNELNAVTERLLLPESAQIEADTKELQHRADAALQEAKVTLESEQNRLLHMAGIVQQFHEQIMQVLPEIPSHRQPAPPL